MHLAKKSQYRLRDTTFLNVNSMIDITNVPKSKLLKLPDGTQNIYAVATQ